MKQCDCGYASGDSRRACLKCGKPFNRPPSPALSLGERLRWCRRVKGKSLREVEGQTNISNSYLSQLETGKIKDPGVFTLLNLSKFYGVSLDDLLEAQPK